MFKRKSLDKHVEKLLNEYDLKLVRTDRHNKATLWTKTPEYRHYQIDLGVFDTKEIEYITTLHEIGHAHCGISSNTNGHSSFGLWAMHVIEDELRAWDWAFMKSIIPIDNEIERYRDRCLDTYYKTFSRRGDLVPAWASVVSGV